MGVEYWPIMGYGAMVTPDMIDPNKAAEFMGTDDYDFGDLLNKLCSLPEGDLLIWAGTGEFDYEEVYFLYCPAMVPWEVKGKWKEATPEAVREAITKLLAPLLRDGVSIKIDEVFAVGCG